MLNSPVSRQDNETSQLLTMQNAAVESWDSTSRYMTNARTRSDATG